jgi:hypothetical protein
VAASRTTRIAFMVDSCFGLGAAAGSAAELKLLTHSIPAIAPSAMHCGVLIRFSLHDSSVSRRRFLSSTSRKKMRRRFGFSIAPSVRVIERGE